MPRASITSKMVARAIAEYVQDDLPRAITAKIIADIITKQLLDDMGMNAAPAQMKRAFIDTAVNELEGGQLRSGCQLYTQQTGRPHVPVSPYFFSNVYTEDVVLRECVEQGALTKFEVEASLPRRSSIARSHDGKPIEGEIVDNSTAGFVIFAPGSSSPLLLVWMLRQRDVGMKTTSTKMRKVASAVLPSAVPQIEGAIRSLDNCVPVPDDPVYRD